MVELNWYCEIYSNISCKLHCNISSKRKVIVELIKRSEGYGATNKNSIDLLMCETRLLSLSYKEGGNSLCVGRDYCLIQFSNLFNHSQIFTILWLSKAV